MDFLLTMPFDEDLFEFKGEIFNVDMAFDNILLLFEMFDDEEIEDHEKVFLTFQMLIFEHEHLKFDTYEEAYELFKYLLREFLYIDLDNQSSDGQSKVKMYDYQKDAELIFASFFAVYNMDLAQQQGKLHWKKFQALLTHLDDNSPFKKVIGYRVMKVPSEKESSKDYRQHVLKMKSLYSLDDGPQDATSVFDSLANSFKHQKGGGEG